MMERPVLKILRRDSRVPLPEYESEGAAGMDIRAYLQEEEIIPPLGRAKIPTGLMLEISPGYEAQIRPRSGLALKYGITVLNAPGTIDFDYRGEIEILLVNLGIETFIVQNGERIAQLVFAPVTRPLVEVVHVLSDTKRGAGGFGSTGV